MTSIDTNRSELWLVRHGESIANAGLATSDYSAIPLTSTGHAQATAVADACTESPTWIGVSRYIRARETAQQLIERYPSTPTIEVPVHEFTYLSTTRCQHLDPNSRQPLVDAYWSRMDPLFCDGEGAESFTVFWHRAIDFLNWATTQKGQGIVFTHEQFIRAVLIALIYSSPASSTEIMQQFFALRSGLPVPNCAIIRLKFQQDRWWFGNIDTSHLTCL